MVFIVPGCHEILDWKKKIVYNFGMNLRKGYDFFGYSMQAKIFS